ncbi:MAG: tRNA pseudouridine(13) synthase TruD [Deltaproteobacteria bacterium]|nr:tRNA pseudouridine(13) synthase TruD [Deltaproteobacteria bacterium]
MRYLLPDAPPVRGALKIEPEDFVVEELPAYLPSGEGDHLYLWVQKRGRTTQEVAALLATTFGVREREVGHAGQKDRQAVTRQWFSLPRPRAEGALEASPEDEAVTILERRLHRNKLKTGHLRGNRFWLRLRGAAPDREAAEAILRDLERRGVPNYYGEQRFGRDGRNPELGRQVLRGELQPKRHLRKLYLSALQSSLFNAWLDARIDDGLLDVLVPGDLLQRRDGRGVFLSEEPAEDGARLAAGEIDPTGPIFGPRMRQPGGEAAAREARILEASGLTMADLEAGGRLTQGTRRAARIGLSELELGVEGDDLQLAFTLPRGAYATVVTAQLLR